MLPLLNHSIWSEKRRNFFFIHLSFGNTLTRNLFLTRSEPIPFRRFSMFKHNTIKFDTKLKPQEYNYKSKLYKIHV